MLFEIISVFVKLIAAYYLVVSGLILYLDWKKEKRDSLYLWGLGLIFLAIVALFDIFTFVAVEHDIMFLFIERNILLIIALVMFLFKGTARLIITEKQVKLFTRLLLVFCIGFYLVTNTLVSDPFAVLAFLNVYLINPIAVLHYFFFIHYYNKYKNLRILGIAFSWAINFIVNIFYAVVSVIEIAEVTNYVLLLNYFSLISIAFGFYQLQKISRNEWEQITEQRGLVIDSNFRFIVTKYMSDGADEAIKKYLQKYDVLELSDLSFNKRREFIQNFVNDEFACYSTQKRYIIESELLKLYRLKRRDKGFMYT